jgi:hypothetical protein
MSALRNQLIVAATVIAPYCALAQAPTTVSSVALLDSAIEAMGGTSTIATLRSARIEGVRHEYQLGNAERNEGPFRTSYTRFSELRDGANGRLRREDVSLSSPTTPAVGVTYVLADSMMTMRRGTREFGGLPILFDDLADQLAANPEIALVAGRAASGLRSDGTVLRYGVVHDIVSWPYANGRMRAELDRDTHLPTRISLTRSYPRDFRRAQLGDVTVSYDLTDWIQEEGGLVYPHQIISRVNGEPQRDVTISTITRDAAAPADSFQIGDSARVDWARNVKLSPASFHLGDNGTLPDVADGIVRLKDFWATTLVKQTDGVLIFEAHLSGQYLRDVIAEAARRWPGARVKGLVMTSDPWAHLGGLREAVALGIPIYVSGRSIPALTAVLKTPHTLATDVLATAPRAPQFIAINARTSIGAGVNRVELFPVRGAYAERMTMAYFPEQKLLYGADLVFASRPAGTGYFRTAAIDLLRAVGREGLTVERLFCVQATPVIQWKDFTASPK